jgi:predicted DNA-binding transcriptional regulator AlpA
MTTATAEPETQARAEADPLSVYFKSDLAKLFQVEPETISLWVRQKRLPSPQRIGRKPFWPKAVIAAWVQDQGQGREGAA